MAARPHPWRARTIASPNDTAIDPVIAGARAEARTLLLEFEARALLDAHGAPLVAVARCASREETADAAEAFGGTVAVRVVSPAAAHKTEAGGVLLNVTGGSAAAAAFDHIAESVAEYARSRGEAADVRGVLVSPMQPRPVAELIVGVVRDEQFGPVLTVGAGGTLVEVLRDVALRVLPVSAEDVREMLAELRIAPQLEGVRGRPGADIDAIVRATLALAETALATDAIAEIEMNPLFAYANGCVALDARAWLTPPPPS
jgi:acyl-CoA synthetase (NDP forming)